MNEDYSKNLPLISVIIPFYNRSSVVIKAIESVVNQEFQNWELILVDDGSTDDISRIKEIVIKDSRIKYYYQSNEGVCAARNFGVSNSNSEWVVFLDSDDFFLYKALSIFFLAIKENHEISVFFSGYIRKSLDSQEKLILPKDGVYIGRLSGNFVLKKSVFNTIGGYDQFLKFGENTELFHRIEIAGYKSLSIQSPSFVYNFNPKGGSKNLNNSTQSILYILEKHNCTLSDQLKFLYHQILGVNYIRFRLFSEARFHLKKAFLLKPTRFDTFGRLIVSLFPFIAKKIYSSEVEL